MSIKLKLKNILRLIIILLIINIGSVKSQQVGYYYDYDDSGNREQRTYTTVFLRPADTIAIETQVFLKHYIKIYPNPTLNELKVEVSNLTEDTRTRVEIHNMKGKLLFSKDQLENENVFDFGSYTTGMYFLTIYIDTKKEVFKVIKE